MSGTPAREAVTAVYAKVQQAIGLLRSAAPPPDMPVHVEQLLQETLDDLRSLAGVHAWPEPTTERPDLETLEAWMWDDASCEATDGCVIEPDGICPHGHPSWLLRLGLI